MLFTLIILISVIHNILYQPTFIGFVPLRAKLCDHFWSWIMVLKDDVMGG